MKNASNMEACRRINIAVYTPLLVVCLALDEMTPARATAVRRWTAVGAVGARPSLGGRRPPAFKLRRRSIQPHEPILTNAIPMDIDEGHPAGSSGGNQNKRAAPEDGEQAAAKRSRTNAGMVDGAKWWTSS